MSFKDFTKELNGKRVKLISLYGFYLFFTTISYALRIYNIKSVFFQ